MLPSLEDWVEVVACVDPVEEHCDRAAAALGVRAYDVRELVRDGIAEAALVVTPVPSHYAYSIYLSSHGIHNLCETTWCSLVAQAREMIRVGREQEVVVRVVAVHAPQHTHPHPHFSPGERYVVFASDQSGHAQVYESRVEI